MTKRTNSAPQDESEAVFNTAAELFGLSERECDWVATMVRGRALWRLQRRGAVVHTVLTDAERQVCDTDRSMTA